MSSVRQAHYKKSCLGKIRYGRHDQAQEVVDRMHQENKTKGAKERMEVYRCDFCRGYHVGHEVEREKKIKRSVSKER